MDTRLALRRLQHGNGRRHSLGELQVECHRKTFLTWVRLRPVESIGFGGRRESGVLTDCQGTQRIHGAVRDHEGTEEYPTHSSDVPDLRGLPWCRLIFTGISSGVSQSFRGDLPRGGGIGRHDAGGAYVDCRLKSGFTSCCNRVI